MQPFARDVGAIQLKFWVLNGQWYDYGWFKIWCCGTRYAEAAFGILTKTDDCRTHYVAVTRHRVIKLAHCRSIGPAVILWLAVGLTNWLTAAVQIRIIVGDLTKLQTTLTPTQIIMLQIVLADRFDTLTDPCGIFWSIAFWFTPLSVASPSTATFAKPDARGQNYLNCQTDWFCRSSMSVYDPQWCHELL